MSKQKNIPNQTFDNFIVSRSNKKAYSACLDLANNPQGKFVVIYGANSLGKTHLLYAVNNALIRKKPDLKICLINYEDLISQYITALHKNDTDIFLDRLLETDLLIVDNMQFVAGKNYTQEDIASWVNKMILMGKTVVMSFDRPIKYYPALIKGTCESNPENCKAIEIKKPDYLLRKEYIDHILKEYSVSLPSFVKKYLVYLSRMTFSAMKGFLCKLSFIEKQNGTKVSNLDIKKCLSSYVVWKLR